MSLISCPKCNGRVSESANICPHCNSDIKDIAIKCPECSRTIAKKVSLCPFCGFKVNLNDFIPIVNFDSEGVCLYCKSDDTYIFEDKRNWTLASGIFFSDLIVKKVKCNICFAVFDSSLIKNENKYDYKSIHIIGLFHTDVIKKLNNKKEKLCKDGWEFMDFSSNLLNAGGEFLFRRRKDVFGIKDSSTPSFLRRVINNRSLYLKFICSGFYLLLFILFAMGQLWWSSVISLFVFYLIYSNNDFIPGTNIHNSFKIKVILFVFIIISISFYSNKKDIEKISPITSSGNK